MLKKLMMLGAGATGYVLGAAAGRQRYEQISAQARKLRSHPTVQRSVEDAKVKAKDVANTAVSKVKGGGAAPASSTTMPPPTMTASPLTTPTMPASTMGTDESVSMSAAPSASGGENGFGRGDESI
jgi:hypothetical protein